MASGKSSFPIQPYTVGRFQSAAGLVASGKLVDCYVAVDRDVSIRRWPRGQRKYCCLPGVTASVVVSIRRWPRGQRKDRSCAVAYRAIQFQSAAGLVASGKSQAFRHRRPSLCFNPPLASWPAESQSWQVAIQQALNEVRPRTPSRHVLFHRTLAVHVIVTSCWSNDSAFRETPVLFASTPGSRNGLQNQCSL